MASAHAGAQASTNSRAPNHPAPGCAQSLIQEPHFHVVLRFFAGTQLPIAPQTTLLVLLAVLEVHERRPLAAVLTPQDVDGIRVEVVVPQQGFHFLISAFAA